MWCGSIHNCCHWRRILLLAGSRLLQDHRVHYILPLHGLYMGTLPSICRLAYFTYQLLCNLTSYQVQSITSSEVKRRTAKPQLAVDMFILLIRQYFAAVLEAKFTKGVFGTVRTEAYRRYCRYRTLR